MSLVEGSSALQQTVETANALKVVSETTQQTAEIYSISQYLTETQASQPQAALGAWKYVESLQAYVPQVVTGLTATAGGAYAAVSGGVAYVLSVPAAFCAIAAALGIGVGVGMYQVNPNFWDRLTDRLISEGALVGGGVLSILNGDTNYIPESTIQIIKDFLIEEGAYNITPESDLIEGSTITFNSASLDTFASFVFNAYNKGFSFETGIGTFSDFTKDAFLTGVTWLINNAPALPTNCFYAFTWSQTATGLPYRHKLRLYVLEKPTSAHTVDEGSTNAYLDFYEGGRYNFIMSPSANFNIIGDILEYAFAIYNNQTSTSYYEQPSTSVITESILSSSGYTGFTPCYFREMGRTTVKLLGIDMTSNSGVEGLNLETGADIPSEQGTIAEDYPSWHNDGMTFLRPTTREIGENPTLDPDDVEEFKALPVEIPDTVGNPMEVGYTNPQITTQDGEVPDPSADPDPEPDSEPVPAWKRVIKGIGNIVDPNPDPDPEPYPSPVPTPVPSPEPATPDEPVDPPTDDGGDTPPIVPPISTLGTGMNNVYNPSSTEMREFNAFLWSNDFIDNIKKILNDPMDAVIALQLVYCTPPTESGHTIVVGSLDTEVSSDIVTNQYVTIDCGTVTIPEYFKDYTDYSPYTKIVCYLPFIGFVNLEADDIVGSSTNITYTVDLYTGTCLAQIKVTKNNMSAILYSFNGNCAVQIPLTSSMRSSILGVLGGMSTVGLGLGTGNPLMVLGGLATVGISYNKNDVSRSGSLGANAGAMGLKKPYIIIRRPVAYNAQRYNEYIGIPSNTTVVLGTLEGYTRVRETHVELIETATDSEKDMIYKLLKEGVIF